MFGFSQSSGAVWKWRRPPGLPVPRGLYGLGGRKATLNLNYLQQSSVVVWQSRWPSCPSWSLWLVSVDVKQHWTWTTCNRAQELCESGSGRPGLPVPYGLCGREGTLTVRDKELCESGGGRPGLPNPYSPYGLCGRKATANLNSDSLALFSQSQARPVICQYMFQIQHYFIIATDQFHYWLNIYHITVNNITHCIFKTQLLYPHGRTKAHM